ncbi:hypothetical protein, partial [Photobacterium galatheae]|uniref:hypothetical protein n=1 Tax=Photobacterium galatheae TaxID=1654360 RepID=UPI001F452C35
PLRHFLRASVKRLGLFYIPGFEIRPATGRVPVVCDPSRPPFLQETQSYHSGKLTGQVNPLPRAHLFDSLSALQKLVPCRTDLINNIAIISETLIG